MNIRIISPIFYIALSLGLVLFLELELLVLIDPIVLWFIVVNLVAFFAFGKDKLAAVMDFGRTPESTFYILGLLGAWPGLFIGRTVFNHKTNKAAFYVPMFILFFIEMALVYWYFEDIQQFLGLTPQSVQQPVATQPTTTPTQP